METVAKPVAKSIVSSFFNICLKDVLKIFWKNFLSDPTFISSTNASHHSHRRTGRHFTGEAEKNCPENNNLP